MLNKFWINIKRGWAEYCSVAHHQPWRAMPKAPGIVMSSSKSTDKLSVLNSTISDIFNTLPQEKLDKVKSVQITWSEFGRNSEAVICPNLDIQFFE